MRLHWTMAGLWLTGLVSTAILPGPAVATEGERTPAERQFTSPAEVRISTERALLVTHVCTVWDHKKTTKAANDATIAFAEANELTTIYLQHNLDTTSYFYDDKDPDYIVYSSGGEFSFKVDARIIYSTGGYYSYCHRQTMRDLVNSWKGTRDNREVHLVTPAIYEDTNSYTWTLKPGLREKFEAVQERRDTSTAPLADLLDQLGDDKTRVEILTKWAKKEYSLEERLPDHRILIRYRGEEQVAQEGKAPSPPTLTYFFHHPQEGESLEEILEDTL